MTKFMSFIDEVQPDAIINMAHGRMGDKMVDYLKAKNILLFAPLTINSLVDEWEKDPMGMAGGFMSQSIVTPKLTVPSVLSLSLHNMRMKKDCAIRMQYLNAAEDFRIHNQ